MAKATPQQVKDSQKKRKDEGETSIRSSPIWIDSQHITCPQDRRRITAEATGAARKVLEKYLKKSTE